MMRFGKNGQTDPGRGVSYSTCKQANCLELGSTWLTNICLSTVRNDAPSVLLIFVFFHWRLENQPYEGGGEGDMCSGM